jgi:hypothetical protein
VIPLYEVSRIVKLIKAKSKMTISGGFWVGRKESCLMNVYGVAVLQDEKF